jgi:hypothetical protein
MVQRPTFLMLHYNFSERCINAKVRPQSCNVDCTYVRLTATMDILRPWDFYSAVYPIFGFTRILGLAPASLSDNTKNRHIKPSKAKVLYSLLLLTDVVTLYVISKIEQGNGNITTVSKKTKYIFDVRELTDTVRTAVSILTSCLNSLKVTSTSPNTDYIDRSMVSADVQISFKLSLRLFEI